MLNEYNNV